MGHHNSGVGEKEGRTNGTLRFPKLHQPEPEGALHWSEPSQFRK